MPKSRSRALEWSKEVERRARDVYRNVWPDAQRAKFEGREGYAGHPDIVHVPVHVQVKARASSTVATLFRDADSVRATKRTGTYTHLVTQADNSPLLVTMKLEEYMKEREELEEWRKYGMDNLGSIPPKLVVRTVNPLNVDHP